MNDPCKVDPYTLTVDTGCQWDRAVTLWNAGLSGKVTTILIVAALVTLAVVAIRLAVEVWQETRPAANRRRHARRTLARARRRHPVGGWHR